MSRPGRLAIVGASAAGVAVVLAVVAWTGARDDGPGAPVVAAAPRILFDDFAHAGRRELAARGWTIRTVAGPPGVAGATWSPGGVALVADPRRPGNRLVRLTAATDGSPAGTAQAQLCHGRAPGDGTYAARIRFRVGSGSDAVVVAFDGFEYLPRGPAGTSGPVLLAPAAATPAAMPGLEGWHTLVAQVGDGEIASFVDGAPLAASRSGAASGTVAIALGVWLAPDGLGAPGPSRRYDQDVDWVFHQAGALLAPGDVAAAVASLRRAGVAFQDTVLPARPPAPLCGGG